MCASTSFSSSSGVSSLAPYLGGYAWPSTSVSSLRWSSDISLLKLLSRVLASAIDVALDLVLVLLVVVGAVLGATVLRSAVLGAVALDLVVLGRLVVRATPGGVGLDLFVFPLFVRHLAPPLAL